MGQKDCCSKHNKCGVQEGDCDQDEDCKDDLVCGKNNCIKNYDFWWDASDDCCETRKSKSRNISKIQNIVDLISYESLKFYSYGLL